VDNRQRLQVLLREVLDDPSLKLTDDMGVGTHEGWDSVAMVQIVLATEAEFGLRFATNDVANLRTVKDLLAVVARHGK
jgi:acyl carrier protein